jgi:hypothetical protein
MCLSVLTRCSFTDVHTYFNQPSSKPVHHRFDKGSYLYLYYNSIQRRARLEIANSAGTPDQDAFNGCTAASHNLIPLHVWLIDLHRLGSCHVDQHIQAPKSVHHRCRRCQARRNFSASSRPLALASPSFWSHTRAQVLVQDPHSGSLLVDRQRCHEIVGSDQTYHASSTTRCQRGNATSRA